MMSVPTSARPLLTLDSRRATVFIALALLLVAVFVAFPADARTLSGPEVGWTRLADRVLVSGSRFALIVPILGVVLFGAAIALGFSLSPALDLIVAGALATLGGAAISTAFGAELSTLALPAPPL